METGILIAVFMTVFAGTAVWCAYWFGEVHHD